MRKRRTTRLAGKGTNAGAVLLCLVGASGAAKAQDVLAPLPQVNTTPPAVQEMQAEGQGYIGGAPKIPNPPSWLEYGPFYARPHFVYSMSYDTGLQSDPGLPQSSFVQRVSPGVTFGAGRHWTLDYTPTFTFYTTSQLHDTVDHALSLAWGTAYDDWSYNFSQSYLYNDDPSVQTGTQTAVQSLGTSIGVAHSLNSKVSFDVGVSQSIVVADQFSSSETWNVNGYLNYQFYPRLTAGVGGGVGYTKVSVGPDMVFEDLQLRLQWRVSNKLSAELHGGGEERQYLEDGSPSTLTPIYGASIVYAVLTPTTITFSADRSTTPALFGSQVVESTTVGLGVVQKVFERFTVNAGAGYSVQDYQGTSAQFAVVNNQLVNESPPGRRDWSYSANASISWAFWEHASANIGYTYNQNYSTVPGFTYASSQIGATLTYSF